MSFSRIALTLALSVGFLSSVVGCNLRHNRSANDKEKDKDKVGAPTEIHSATLTKGLEAEGNDQNLVTLARAALAECPRDEKWSFTLFDSSCPAYKAWMGEPALKNGPSEATLVSFLEDPNERVRFLGARGLSEATAYQTDRALSTRIIAAAAVERSKALFDPLGDRVARINVAKTGLLDSIIEIIKQREQPDLSIAIVDRLLFTNSAHRPTYDFFVSLTHDSDKRIRSKAVGAFWIGGSLSKPETCKVWESHLEDPDDEIAAHSANLLGWYHACSGSYEALLGSLESRVKAKRLGSASASDFGSAPGKMCEDTNANVTPAQKQRGAALARTIASSKDLHEFLRGDAIRSVAACDPKGGRAFAARFKNDKSSYVKRAVTSVLNPSK